MFTLNYTRKRKKNWQKIWAKQVSGLTTVWLKWDPPVLPQMSRKQKHVIITTIVSSFIGLAYEGISSFLYTKKETKLYIKQSRLWIAKPQSSTTN